MFHFHNINFLASNNILYNPHATKNYGMSISDMLITTNVPIVFYANVFYANNTSMNNTLV